MQEKLPDFQKMGKALLEDTARYAGVESVKFFKESFVNGGFTDTSFIKWTEATNPFHGNRTLYNKGILMQSIRTVEETLKRVIVESDTPYSSLHNEGETIQVTKKMKSFWWAKYYELAGEITGTKRGTASSSRRNIMLSERAEFCKAMALLKEGTYIKMDRRQFMGESKAMMEQFSSWYAGEIQTRFPKA